MQKFLWGTFLFLLAGMPLYLHAQNQVPSVRITEIAPQALDEEEEWFEFTLQSNTPVDISDWSITNGTNTKTFEGKKDFLVGNGVTENKEGRLIFSADQMQYLYWTESPVSLSNSGATLQILDENQNILDEITYPNTKKGTQDGEEYTEIWNRTEGNPAQNRQVFPLLYRQNDQNLRHSRGEENFDPPTFPEDIEILISESSPDNADTDFVEIYIKSVHADRANLKYMEIKQKNSPRTLMYFLNDFWINAGDFIVLHFDNAEINAVVQNQNPYQVSTTASGLSGGSETIEVILYSGTSWEESEDFMCWKSGELSQTVRSEVDKKIQEGVWNGECIEIEDLIKNESTARSHPQTDTNRKEDFFRHFNGSEGEQNFPQNTPPIAKFIVQGGAKIFHTSLNFTGLDGTPLTSQDPDGEQDLKSFQWHINEKICGNYAEDGWEWRQTRIGERTCEEESARSNPDRIYFDFERFPQFEVSLTVEDFSGATDTFSELVDRDPFNLNQGGTSSAFAPQVKEWIQKEFQKEKTQKKEESFSFEKENVSEDFFDDFLNIVNFSEQLPSQSPLPPLPSPFVLFEKENFSESERKILAKNIGFIFVFETPMESESDTEDLPETSPPAHPQ